MIPVAIVPSSDYGNLCTSVTHTTNGAKICTSLLYANPTEFLTRTVSKHISPVVQYQLFFSIKEMLRRRIFYRQWNFM